MQSSETCERGYPPNVGRIRNLRVVYGKSKPRWEGGAASKQIECAQSIRRLRNGLKGQCGLRVLPYGTATVIFRYTMRALLQSVQQCPMQILHNTVRQRPSTECGTLILSFTVLSSRASSLNGNGSA